MGDDKRWWDIISVGCPRDADPEEWTHTLRAVLATLPADDIRAFDFWFTGRVAAAFREDLWRAAHIINDGASHDDFYFFRHWLVGRGKKVYEAAVLDPDTLAGVVEPGGLYDWVPRGVGMEAWCDVTGRPAKEFLTPEARAVEETIETGLVEADWPDSAEGRRRHFPKLYAAYLSGENP